MYKDDWRAQAPGSTVTPADVDTNYQDIINSIGNGTWSTKGSVLLAHQSSESTSHCLKLLQYQRHSRAGVACIYVEKTDCERSQWRPVPYSPSGNS